MLTLSFTGAAIGYWLSSYTSSGAQQAATAFARTVGAIGLLISSPYIFQLATEAVNQLTAGIIGLPVVAHGMTTTIREHVPRRLALTQGGVGMIAALIAVVMALALILVKITITALLAVLYVLSPLAIGLWPVEQLSWLLRTLLQVAFIALIFPVLWAACFAVFAVLSPTFTAALGALSPLVGCCGVDHRVQAAVRVVADLDRRGSDPVGQQGDERDLPRPRSGESVMSGAVTGARPGSSNEPYRHLEDREEILWGLHFRQLVYVLGGALIGIVFGLYVSPLPAGPTLMVAVIVAGLPVVLSLVASNGELAPWTVTYALWRWWRSPKLYIPGANPVPGYHIREQQEPRPSPRAGGGAPALAQLEELL